MAVRRVQHTAISTPDLERAIAFWSELGFTEVRRWDWSRGNAVINGFLGLADSAARAALLEGHGHGVELFEFEVPDPPGGAERPVHRPGYTHLCFEVEGLDDEMARLGAAGMTFWDGPVTDPTGRRMVYGRDPDGNVVELVEPPGPAGVAGS
jgi:glyoxylase I family protein